MGLLVYTWIPNAKLRQHVCLLFNILVTSRHSYLRSPILRKCAQNHSTPRVAKLLPSLKIIFVHSCGNHFITLRSFHMARANDHLRSTCLRYCGYCFDNRHLSVRVPVFNVVQNKQILFRARRRSTSSWCRRLLFERIATLQELARFIACILCHCGNSNRKYGRWCSEQYCNMLVPRAIRAICHRLLKLSSVKKINWTALFNNIHCHTGCLYLCCAIPSLN